MKKRAWVLLVWVVAGAVAYLTLSPKLGQPLLFSAGIVACLNGWALLPLAFRGYMACCLQGIVATFFAVCGATFIYAAIYATPHSAERFTAPYLNPDRLIAFALGFVFAGAAWLVCRRLQHALRSKPQP